MSSSKASLWMVKLCRNNYPADYSMHGSPPVVE